MKSPCQIDIYVSPLLFPWPRSGPPTFFILESPLVVTKVCFSIFAAPMLAIKLQLESTRTDWQFGHHAHRPNSANRNTSFLTTWRPKSELWNAHRLWYVSFIMSLLENLSSSCILPIGTEVILWSQSDVSDACLNLL